MTSDRVDATEVAMRYGSDGDGLQSAIASGPDTDLPVSAAWRHEPESDDIDDEDFCDMLLAGLVTMAAKSKRRQADLNAVLRRGRLMASPDRVRMALHKLEEASCIREVVPLYDGGMLVTVTNMGMDLLGRSAHWRFLQELRSAHS